MEGGGGGGEGRAQPFWRPRRTSKLMTQRDKKEGFNAADAALNAEKDVKWEGGRRRGFYSEPVW